jgi:hypothetical protein
MSDILPEPAEVPCPGCKLSSRTPHSSRADVNATSRPHDHRVKAAKDAVDIKLAVPNHRPSDSMRTSSTAPDIPHGLREDAPLCHIQAEAFGANAASASRDAGRSARPFFTYH